MDHGSTLTVDNCVIDLTEGFFNKDDEGGIVGIWCESSKPKARHTLIIANPDFSKINKNTGLFAGYSDSSSNMELSNCFIHSSMSTYLSSYNIVSKQIATRSSGKCEVNDMMSLDCIGTSAKVAGNIVKMNRKGACYGIGSEFIMPLTSDEGKLVGFSGKSYISKASGGVHQDYTISPDHNFVVMAKGKNMTYETSTQKSKWIIADKTTKMSDKKRTGSWSFAGKPTDDEGQFDFAFSPRPVIKWIDDYPKYDQTSQRVTLKWDVSSSRFAEDWKGHGKWVIKKNNVIVKELDSQEKMEWTDIDPSGNGKITYSVFFVSDEYYYSVQDNEVYPSYTLTPIYSINLKGSTPQINNGKVINTVQVPNAQCLNGSRVRLLRWDTSMAEKTGNNIAEILKHADDLTVFSEEFLNNPQKEESTLPVTNEQVQPEAFYCTAYSYMWVIDNIRDSHFSGKTFTTNVLMLTNTNDVNFKEFTATKGKNTSKTTLKWTVNNPDNLNMKYIIYRNSYDKDDTSSPDTWTQVYEANSGLTSGSFDDEVLPGYVYRYCIRAYPFCEGTASRMNVASEMYDIGFAASRGTIQGRVTFNSGKTNVEGVDVKLQPDDDELASSMFSYAVQFVDKNQNMPLAQGLSKKFWDGDWTLQFILRPDKDGVVANLPGRMKLTLKADRLYLGSSTDARHSIRLNAMTFQGNYVILKHTDEGYQLGYITLDENDKAVINWTVSVSDADMASSAGSAAGDTQADILYFGSNKACLNEQSFIGCVDEIRLWEDALSDKSIADTYNRYLSGNEKGLMAYYTFDSGVGEYAFDSSHPSGSWNNRHSELPTEEAEKPIVTSKFVPEADVLTYRGTTDKNGEYTISGIPFEGEGTNWNIVPALGAHDFSPTSSRRLVSTSTLVHSGIDFTDISSFKVSGRVYYENTNIPVDGCNITIDGALVYEGSSAAETNANGEFSVDVPIGTHTLAISMDGHTFTDSLTMYFNKQVKDLWFYDLTKSVVAGRVCGGEMQYEQPLGLAQSKNNIGTAYITLKPTNDNYYFTAETDRNSLYVVPSTKQIDYKNALEYGNDSWAHTGKAAGETEIGDANRIYIKTDSLTGEFAVSLPPMRYELIDIIIPSADEAVNARLKQSLGYLDARNMTQEMTDSAWTGQTKTTGEKVYKQFTYNNTCKIMITTPAVFDVWQNVSDANFFGEDSVTYVGNDGKERKVAAYENGNYVIGADGSAKRPVFTQFESYTLYMQASQKYLNKDNKAEVQEDVMPLRNKLVTINNGMAYENYWYVDENGNTSFSETEGIDCELDSLGRGVYKFKVGAPNTVAPYEESISMALDKGLAEFNLTGIVFGAVSFGNSFVTRGPDVLSMILRDPPGSKSYATWKKGSSIITGYTTHKFSETDNGENSEIYVGYAPTVTEGAMEGQYGVHAVEQNHNMYLSGDNTVSGFTNTITATQDISTSSAPEFDGPEADLFIGSSVNMVSGNGKQVGLIGDETGVRLGVKDVKTQAFEFNTSFVYSHYDIKKFVIPNLLAERRKLIENPLSLPNDSSLHYVPKIDYNMWLSYTDEEKDALLDKGVGEGYEVKCSVPQYATDSVALYKMWADDWKNVLRDNEKAKVDAYTGNYIKDNYTFDAGSSQTITTTTDEMKIITDETGVDGYSFENHFGIKGYYGPIGESEFLWSRYSLTRTETRNFKDEENVEAFSFTLADNDANDILTVDRMTAPDGFSDIFRTRAGQTSAFWAPQYVTEYYQPGTEIMAPTLMVNKPRLELVDPTQQIVSNVRRGTSATIQFRLINDSEAKCNGYYRLGINAEENTNGAKCSFNGTILNNEGVLVWLEYGKPQVVTVNVDEPQNPVDGTYNLTFFLIDDKQTRITGPMNIYPSEVPVIVQFVKSSSEIALAADKTVINAESIRTGNGKVHFTLKDYDVKMENLLYIDLQQWDGTMFVSLGDSARWEKKNGLEESVTYVLDLSDINTFPDGEYRFRARTVSNYGEGNVEAYSDEIIVLKDVSAPQSVNNLMPVRGVLSNDNEISVEFNEDIVGDIRKNTNVVLYGELVSNASAREVSVFFNGGDDIVSTDVPTVALQGGTAKSFNLWIKWMGEEGTILSFGGTKNANRFGIDAAGHFVIYSSKSSLTSVNTFERNKWTFLSLIIDNTTPDTPTSITASYIIEDGKDVVWLLGDKNGGEHLDGLTTSASLIILGKGFNGNIQDVSLWDGIRDMDKSNNEKALKKTRFTKDLIAYWPLNEGYGKIAKEVVSEQNMYLSSENMWSIDNKNYSMRLEKGQKAQLIFSNLNTNYNEDYLFQAWFNVDKDVYDSGSSETDTLVSYPSTGSEATTSFVIPRKTGNLVLKCKKDSFALGSKKITDGYWHQLSFMVKKSENGNATVYLDGDNVGQIAAMKVDDMQGLLFLGDKSGFSGYFDEIRIWNGLQNSQMISENLNKRYSSTDCPIAAYFPFEVSGKNQTVDFTLANYGNMKAEGDTVRLVVTDPDVPLSQLTIAPETEIVAPLKNMPTLVTRDFTIVNSERKIRINIAEEELKDVQGTTVTALVRGLHDKAGNTIQDIIWSFLVEINDIEWGELYTLDYDYDTQGDLVGMDDIINKTGVEQSWRIENVPYWMELSNYGGVLNPNEKLTIIIRAKENIPIGSNIGILSLVDGKGIYHKQQYSINHIPNSPDWVVTTLYSQVMTVTGQVRINNIIQENSMNKLAAFNESGDCIGVVTPEYIREKNSYYYTLMIYGNEDYIGKNVTFKFYDASTGTYYASVEPSEPIVFGGDYSNVGSIEAPIYWDTTGKIEQIIDINKGWNWISFNTWEESPLEEVFKNPQPTTIYTEVKDKNNFARYYNGTWEYDSDFGTITHSKMYKVKAEGSATITRIGTPVNQSGSRIRIVGMANGNPGWSWIGANVSTNMPLTTAMGGLTSAPKVGDVIKNYNQFAEYTTSGWIGRLNTIIPGKGYMYMSNDEANKYLVYPVSSNYIIHSSSSSPKNAHAMEGESDDDLYAEYGGSATMIAAVECDGIRMDGCRIYAIDNENNIRGCKVVSDKDNRHLAYLVIHGNDPETVGFKVVFGEGDNMQTFESATTFDYYDGLSVGTSAEPFVIKISDVTGIKNHQASAINPQNSQYDLSGRPVSASQTKHRKGVYIKNNKKVIYK